MVKEVGAGVDRDSEMFSAVREGGRVVDRVVVASTSSRRSLLAR